LKGLFEVSWTRELGDGGVGWMGCSEGVLLVSDGQAGAEGKD